MMSAFLRVELPLPWTEPDRPRYPQRHCTWRISGADGSAVKSRIAAAKAYVLNLGEALHHELAPAGVDVTVMLPGSVDTPVIDALGLRRAALPIRPQPAEAAVRETVTAFLKHRPLHIPGRLMRIMTRLTPRSLSVRINGRMLGQAARNLTQRQAAPAE